MLADSPWRDGTGTGVWRAPCGEPSWSLPAGCLRHAAEGGRRQLGVDTVNTYTAMRLQGHESIRNWTPVSYASRRGVRLLASCRGGDLLWWLPCARGRAA